MGVERIDVEGDIHWLAAQRRDDVVHVPVGLIVAEVDVHAVRIGFVVACFWFGKGANAHRHKRDILMAGLVEDAAHSGGMAVGLAKISIA